VRWVRGGGCTVLEGHRLWSVAGATEVRLLGRGGLVLVISRVIRWRYTRVRAYIGKQS